ncbi:cell division protein FtsQ/DivIB [Saccharopolyspora rectivirgula]|jgi:cell division protein FtsQ|uniref:cell division protein FtsQ/DivIB n=1 Tax=Saccharopolyspora rectivirgula TaxID=28042 RepID=UPI0012690015|nr:FtsQ-type POTRA domain-containing protein [Saccharopolyspora rectivirgula]
MATRRRGPARPGKRSTRGRPVRAGGQSGLRWRRIGLLLVLTAFTAFAVAAYFTPVLGVKTVQVVGSTTVDDQQVRAVAGIEPGTPMLRVDAAQVSDRVKALPKIASVTVTRSWPSTVRIQVVEREAVAFFVARNGVQLVDAEGVPFEQVSRKPEELPELKVRAVSEVDPATDAALTALMALSGELRAQVAVVSAEKPTDVRMVLRDGREVHWGDNREAERKAAILPPLLTRPGKVYDVTAPSLPTVA